MFTMVFQKEIITVHMDEMKEVEGQLNNRSIAQIRTKLNNMKLGKFAPEDYLFKNPIL